MIHSRLVLAFALMIPAQALRSAPATTAPIALPTSQRVLEKTLAQPDEYFKSDEGVARVRNIISWQNANGGWWKTYDPNIPRPPSLPAANTTRPGGAKDHEDTWRH